MIETGEEMKQRRKGGERDYKQVAEWGAALSRQEGYKGDRRPDEEETAASHAQGHNKVWAGSCGLRVMALPGGEVEGVERSGFRPNPVALGKSLFELHVLC